ncbi:MAG: Asd/ArgC dimerization domain-containing protein [Thermoanaerobaculia bacterium]
MTRGAQRQLRIGLTDPRGPFARQVREAFHESPISVSRFVSLGPPDHEGELSQIDGEAEVLQAPGRETIGDLDFLILAGSSVDADCRAQAAAAGIPVFDLERDPSASEGCAAVLSACDSLPTSASFTILIPASEAGAGGVEELFEQAGASLNFRPPDVAVFSARLAFNVFRDPATESLDAAVRASLERRFAPCRISATCTRIAVFHGYAASASLRFGSEALAKDAIRRIGSSPEISLGDRPGAASAASAVEERRVLLDPPMHRAEHVSLWIAFDGLARSAASALEAASRLLG